MNLAPIVLFVYNRPWHTEQTLNALMQNELADRSVLYIYADGPKDNASDEQLQNIKEVRKVIRSKKWCKEINIIEDENNKGLASSIISGVTEIVNKYEKVVVLEDDIVTSKGFLKYMNEALEIYQDEEKVMQISAFMFSINSKGLPETFFYNCNSCWGWGTWKRSWSYFNNNSMELYAQLINDAVDWQKFNGYQGNNFKEQLVANVEKRLKTWAVNWHSCMFLKNGFVLHPGNSLTKNIGFDGSGTNCETNELYEVSDLAKNISVQKIPVQEDICILEILKNYFKNQSKISFNQPIKLSAARRSINKLKRLKSFLRLHQYQKNSFITNEELDRLQKLPRYVETKAILFGREIFIADAMTFLSSLEEIFTHEIYKYQPNPDKDIVIIDCGANIGLATIYFKRAFPEAKILAFEADPKISTILKKNVLSLGYNDVEVYNSAVSVTDGEIYFKMEGGHSGMIQRDKDVENIVSVKAQRLKNILNRFKRVSFLKIDIEGHEVDLLPDIAEELKKVDYLFLEYHSFVNEKQQLSKLLNIVSEAGLRYYIKEACNKPFPFLNKEIFLKMDLLINIFCYREA
jgi:FkbM family methyltransferase